MKTSEATFKSSIRSDRGGIFFRLLFLIFLVIFAFAIYLARYPILRFAGNFWVVDESPQTSDAIVILSDDDYEAVRASRAADCRERPYLASLRVNCGTDAARSHGSRRPGDRRSSIPQPGAQYAR